MNHADGLIAGAGLGTSILLGALWSWAVSRVRMGPWLRRLNVLAAVSLALGVVGLLLANGLAPRIVSAAALPLPLLFFGIRRIAGQRPRTIAVRVGEPILDFTALDGQGHRFELSSLCGSPYLLKFYRGHW